MFILQVKDIAKDAQSASKVIANCHRDVKIVDMYSSTESGVRLWRGDEISAMRSDNKNCKILAYLSIGEAGTYRDYWKKDWDDKTKRPQFLLEENPIWRGHYKVKYWDKDWQKIIFDRVRLIADLGFDGIYLDIVDCFEFFEHDPKTNEWRDNLVNPQTRQSYRKDMIDFVISISKLARDKNKDFLIFPQNGVQLLVDTDYRKAISGLGMEDLFSDGKCVKKDSDIKYKLKFVEIARNSESANTLKFFAIDYCVNNESLCEYVKGEAKNNKLSILLTDRMLKTLGTSFSE